MAGAAGEDGDHGDAEQDCDNDDRGDDRP